MIYTPLKDIQTNCAAQKCIKLLDAHIQHWQPKKINLRYFSKLQALLTDFFDTVEYLNSNDSGDIYTIAFIDHHLVTITNRLGFQKYCAPSYCNLTNQHIGKPGVKLINRPDI